jgi:hypothetical protein
LDQSLKIQVSGAISAEQLLKKKQKKKSSSQKAQKAHNQAESKSTRKLGALKY